MIYETLSTTANGSMPHCKQIGVQGSHRFYQKVKAEGGPSAVKKMVCNGSTGKATSDGYFEFGLTTCSLSCRVEFTSGGSKNAGVSVC